MQLPVKFGIVLFRPELPNNVGAIGRLCLGFSASLHMVGPVGFDFSDARAKRAGLDYWPMVDKTAYSDETQFLQATDGMFDATIVFSKAERYGAESLHQFDLSRLVHGAAPSQPRRVALAFGSETAGVTFLEGSAAGRSILQDSSMVYLPMHPSIRSQNLANTAAMGLYEMSRQAGNLPVLEAGTAKRA